MVQRAVRLFDLPEEDRHWVWPVLLATVPLPKHFPRDFPPATTEEASQENDADALEQEVLKAIENDVQRTRNVTHEQHEPMRRVLRAFARRNRRIGYCQGMNEILAVLLQYLSERDALLALSLLLEVVLPAYHVDSMIGLHTDCAVLHALLRQNDTELHTHLQQLGLNMEILCTKWLVTCFLTTLPSEAGLQILDWMLARLDEPHRTASRVLLGAALAIFFTTRDALLLARDAGEVLMAFNEFFSQEMISKTPEELRSFLSFCRHVIDQLAPATVEALRQVHKDEVMERFATFEAKKIEMRHQLEQQRQAAALSASAPSLSNGSSGSHMTGRATIGALPSASSHSTESSNPGRASSVLPKKSTLASFIMPSSTGGSTSQRHTEDGCYQRIDLTTEASTPRNLSIELAKMEEQLEDLADLYVRGRIDEKEHACIKQTIVRKWCKGMNSPQSAMSRVRQVKAAVSQGPRERRSSSGSTNSRRRTGSSRRSVSSAGADRHADASSSMTEQRSKKSGVSLYGRMKKVKKSAIAIFKATFE
ncbi:hypothetical protein PINS_up012628 [Pythium insidiosum]|nr:hypothetical protein PINS_up012628 [Pythium insidiosum]